MSASREVIRRQQEANPTAYYTYPSQPFQVHLILPPNSNIQFNNINLAQHYHVTEPRKKSLVKEITTEEGEALSVFCKPRLELSTYFLRRIPFLLSFAEKTFPLAIHYYVVIEGIDKKGDDCTGKIVAYSVEKTTYRILSSSEVLCLFLFFPVYFFQNNQTLIQVFALVFLCIPFVPLF